MKESLLSRPYGFWRTLKQVDDISYLGGMLEKDKTDVVKRVIAEYTMSQSRNEVRLVINNGVLIPTLVALRHGSY